MGAWLRRHLEAGELGRPQLQHAQEPLNRVGVGTRGAAFEFLDAVHAQPGPLGQQLLGQPRFQTMLPQQISETRGCPIVRATHLVTRLLGQEV